MSRAITPPPVYGSTTALKPYLELPHLLSLTWLAYPILSLLFIAFRLQLSISSSQDSIANAKDDLLSSCKAAEQAATAAASMPRYMAIATNDQFADAVNGTMQGARAALILALTIMETIINFLIDIYRSTFLCFLELVVRGGLSLLISAVQEISSFVTSTFNGLRTNIQNDVSAANSVIQSAVDGINKLKIFGNVSVPQFNIPSLDALQNVTLPTDFENSLIALNNSLPSISDLKNSLEGLIDTPFEAVKADINNTFAGLSFNSSILPVPQLNTLSFCGQMNTSVVDDLGKDLVKAAKIGTLILILLALVLLAGHCALEWYKWRCLKRHLEYTRQAWTSDPTLLHSGPANIAPTIALSDHNLLMLNGESAHPLLTRIANNLSRILRLTQSQHIHLRWFFHYVFHPPALACFLIGFFGLLSIELQLIAIGPLQAKFSAQTAASVSDFSNTIATSINSSMYNQSATYANTINAHVDSVQQTINQGVFGWVNGTTTTLNNTLNTFYDDVQNAVGKIFNGTILESPVQEFIKCFIGSKVDAFEEALTFLHDNLKVDIPRVNQSVLVLSPASVNEATQPIARAAVGGGNDDQEGLVGRLVASYANSLKKERIMFGIFLGLWGIVVLIALGIIFWHSYGKRWVEGRRRRKWQREQRVGINDVVVPFRSGHNEFDNEKNGDESELPAFTPLPSPNHGANPFGRTSPTQDPDRLGVDHPLKSLNPKFEKSWDSFVARDMATQDSPTVASKAISRPMKLMALGRKALGKDKAEEKDNDGANAADGGLLTRIKTRLWKRDQEEELENGSSTDVEHRPRPNLTICASDTVPDNASSGNKQPSSAWSVSPVSSRSKTSWAINPPPPPGLPPRPKPRRNASVPDDVSPNGDHYNDASLMTKSNHTPLAMPIHHGFERRTPPASPPAFANLHLSPPLDRHKRAPPSSLGGPRNVPAGADGTTPLTRFLTTTHARQSSAAVDPFVTPFDDEARVVTPANANYRHPSNPFTGVAV